MMLPALRSRHVMHLRRTCNAACEAATTVNVRFRAESPQHESAAPGHETEWNEMRRLGREKPILTPLSRAGTAQTAGGLGARRSARRSRVAVRLLADSAVFAVGAAGIRRRVPIKAHRIVAAGSRAVADLVGRSVHGWA